MGWGVCQVQDATAGAHSIQEISDKARSESHDVETTSSCSSRCAGFATRKVQSEARVEKTAAAKVQSDARRSQQRSRHLCSLPRTDQENNLGLNPEAGLNLRKTRDSTRKRDKTRDW